MLEKERDNERLDIINIHRSFRTNRQNDVDFPLHGDEMKTQEMENFAADTSKEAEAKANWALNVESLGRKRGQEVCVQKTPMDLKEDFVRFVMLESYFQNHPFFLGQTFWAILPLLPAEKSNQPE